MSMFKSAASKIAHNTTLPSLGGNKDLRPLQDLITAEKAILVSMQKLGVDIAKASEALKLWGQGEGDDLSDTMIASAELLSHWSASISHYATLEHNIRDSMKNVRTREENLAELKKRRQGVVAKADSADKKLSKMGPEHKSLVSQTELLNQLRDQIRSMDTEIMQEEAAMSDFKRYCTRSWMSLKFGGLVECSEKGLIVGDFGKRIIQMIPTDVTQPGLPRSYYNGAQQTQSFVQEALRNLSEVQFSGIMPGQEGQPPISPRTGIAGQDGQRKPSYPMQGMYPSQDTLSMQREASGYSAMDQSPMSQQGGASAFSQNGGVSPLHNRSYSQDPSPQHQRAFSQDQSGLPQIPPPQLQYPGSPPQPPPPGQGYSSPDRTNFMGSAEPMPHEEGPPFLAAPSSVGGGLGLTSFMTPSESSLANQQDAPTTQIPPPGGVPPQQQQQGAPWDRPPQPPFAGPGSGAGLTPGSAAGPGGSVDDFGVPLTPRIGIKPGSGGGGRFATFPVKGARQGPPPPSSLREEVPIRPQPGVGLDPPRSFTSEFGDLIEHSGDPQGGGALPPTINEPRDEEGRTEGGQGEVAPDATPNAGTTELPPPTQGPRHVPPQLDLDGEQVQVEGSGGEDGDTQLAYMSDPEADETDEQRLSRHVRFGENETIGHSVGPILFTPTDTSYSYDSTPPVSATGSQFSGESGDAVSVEKPPMSPGGGGPAMRMAPMPDVPQSAELSPSVPMSLQPQRPSPSRRVPPPAYDEQPSNAPQPAFPATTAADTSYPVPPRSPVPNIVTSGPPGNQLPIPQSPMSPRSDGTSPGPTPTAPPRVDAQAPSPAQGPLSPTFDTPQSRLPPPQALNIPSRSTTPQASYRTPPEYPRNTSYNMSNSSLNSPTLPPSGGKISAAAFRRPPARAPGQDGTSAGIADVSPLAFKKKAGIPASPYPQRMQSREPSSQSFLGGGGTPPPPAAPATPPAPAPAPAQQSMSSSPPTASIPPGARAPEVRQSMPPGDEEDFDYLSAYMNGQEDTNEFSSGERKKRQSVAPLGYGQPPPSGYGGGRFSTNLEQEDSGLR